jgi:hypothetical protein
MFTIIDFVCSFIYISHVSRCFTWEELLEFFMIRVFPICQSCICFVTILDGMSSHVRPWSSWLGEWNVLFWALTGERWKVRSEKWKVKSETWIIGTIEEWLSFDFDFENISIWMTYDLMREWWLRKSTQSFDLIWFDLMYPFWNDWWNESFPEWLRLWYFHDMSAIFEVWHDQDQNQDQDEIITLDIVITFLKFSPSHPQHLLSTSWLVITSMIQQIWLNIWTVWMAERILDDELDCFTYPLSFHKILIVPRFDSTRVDSLRLNSIQFNSIWFDLIWFHLRFCLCFRVCVCVCVCLSLSLCLWFCFHLNKLTWMDAMRDCVTKWI